MFKYKIKTRINYYEFYNLSWVISYALQEGLLEIKIIYQDE